MTAQIHKLNELDIPQLVGLSASVGWDYTPEEIHTILAAGHMFGHKSEDGQLLSSAAIFVYGDRELASVGMVIVDPGQQGRGFGKAVTRACLDFVPTTMPVMLVATDAGSPVYERLGFRTVGTLHKVICEQYRPAPLSHSDGWDVVPLAPEHFEAIVRLDAGATGAERRQFLTARLRQVCRGFVLQSADALIGGFAFAVQGPENLVIGPVVAPNDQLALLLVDRLAQGHSGRIRLDCPSQHLQLLEGLAARGFQTVRQPPVMMLNADRPLGDGALYAIAAQAFG